MVYGDTIYNIIIYNNNDETNIISIWLGMVCLFVDFELEIELWISPYSSPHLQ